MIEKNIATKLMTELETIAFNEGRDNALLVALQNEKALGLYRKLGYQQASIRLGTKDQHKEKYDHDYKG
jgi:ribosomal protein S18 acetylase RimI-like enzyme